MADELKAQVKRKLNVTWDTAETDARINDIMLIAEQDMRHLLGIPDSETFDFSKASIEQGLFLNLCWYKYWNARNDFEEHYAREIARCRDRWMVKQYVEEQEESADV